MVPDASPIQSTSRRTWGWPLSLSISMLIGAVSAAAFPRITTYALTLAMPVVGEASGLELATARLKLSHARTDAQIEVVSQDRDRTRVHVTPRDSISPEELARSFMSELNSKLAARAEHLRGEPSDVESVLTEQLSLHRTRLGEAQQKLDAAAAALPPADPRVDREALRLRWDALRADWASTSGAAQQAAAEIERLRATPDLMAGVVSPPERRAALEADPALQQDLKELHVRLTEIKLHLLNVWQVSAGRLEQLVKESGGFQETLANLDISTFSAEVQSGIQRLRVRLDAYVVTLAAFRNTWTAEFTSVQRSEIDPEQPDILDIQERLRKLLSDFLFAGSKGLGELRSILGESSRTSSASARHHVLESNLTRGFQSVQSAHHRFEFAASTIETPENFRLDASLRSARGLHRRVREQIAVIEKRLEVEAAERARGQRLAALAQAEKTVEELRTVSQRTVTELFNVQDGLLSAGAMTEDFLLAALRVEVIAQSVQVMQRDLPDLDARRSQLETDRLTLAENLHATLVSSEVVARDYQWGMRLRVGLVAGVLSFLAMMLVQRSPRRGDGV